MPKQVLSSEVYLWVTELHSSRKLTGYKEILIKKVLFVYFLHVLYVHTLWASKVGTKMSWLLYLSLPSFVPSSEEAEDSRSRRVYTCSWRLYIHRPWLSGDWEVLLCHFSWFLPWSCKFSCIINTRVTSTFFYFLRGKGLTCPSVWMQTLSSEFVVCASATAFKINKW